MIKKCALFALLALATACARQDPNQAPLMPSVAPPGAEQPQEPSPKLEVAPEREEASEESQKSQEMEELDAPAAPAASAAPAKDADGSAARNRAAKPARSAPITGCASESCINDCKPFGAAKQAACASAFAAGCFEPSRDPLQCGEFGVADEKLKSRENIEEMPAPKLY